MPQIPVPAFPFKHSLPLQTRFNDFDLLGHLNNTIYFNFFDLGKVDYIQQVLGSEFNFRNESMVIANINVDFFHITVLGEPLEVLTRVDAIGTHSFTLEQRIVNSETRQVKTIARVVMVGFNIANDEKMRIPVVWRAKISAFEGRPL